MSKARPPVVSHTNPVTRYLYALVAVLVVVATLVIVILEYQSRSVGAKTDKINNYHMLSIAHVLAIREAINRSELRILRKLRHAPSTADASMINILENLFVELRRHAKAIAGLQQQYNDPELDGTTKLLVEQIRFDDAEINISSFTTRQVIKFVESYLRAIYAKAHQLEKLHEKEMLAARHQLQASFSSSNIQAIVIIVVAMLVGAFFTLHLFKNIRLLFERQLEAEDGIRKLNEELEDRVRQRTIDLQVANNHLQASLQQLSQTQAQLVQSEKMASLGGLVAGVAHEINTPVGVGVTAITHLQMKLEKYAARYQSGHLTREDFESLLGAAAETSQIINTNLKRAADLINSFKQVAVDQASNERRRFNLQEYLQEVLQSLKPKLRVGEHQVSVDCPEHIVLHSHPGALSQILTNLVMNSLIHGFEGRSHGHIRIRVTEAPTNNIRLDYSDDGKGIAAGNVTKIFEPFFTTRRGQGGTGLGMHIVFNLVTQTLGGQIHCRSVEGDGVEFQLELPLGHETEATTRNRQHLAS